MLYHDTIEHIVILTDANRNARFGHNLQRISNVIYFGNKISLIELITEEFYDPY